jgi:small-conductance mechanosensitive channel
VFSLSISDKYFNVIPGQSWTTINLGDNTDRRFLVSEKSNHLSHSFANLLQAIKEDREINTRVIQLLKSNSYTRRLLLNKWLEQLRRRRAPEKLIHALSCLLDDNIAKNVLSLINNHQI